MKKCLLIINPYSGKLKMQNELMNVIQILNENNYNVQVQITLKHNHAREIAATATNIDLIICSGGDGTLNQVVAGVIDSGNNIPSGSTNDFANTLGISADIQKATKDIINGQILNIDIGQFNNQSYFTYVAAFGIFAEVSYSTPQPIKNRLGHLAYILSGLNNISNIKPYTVTVFESNQKDNLSFEMSYKENYIMGMVMNSTSVGGVLKLNQVDLADGLFEVLLIRQPKDLIEFNSILTGLITSDFSGKMFNYFKTKHVKFLFDDEMVWSLDGEEQKAGKHAVINNLNKKINIIK